METSDAVQSPAIDRGDPTTPYANEPADNGQFVNLGAFGNTAQASKSPAEYVLVTSPNGSEVWPAGQAFPIQWRSHDVSGTVDIELYRFGGASPEDVLATAEANDGEFLWVIPEDFTPQNDYLVHVSRAGADDYSDSVFEVTAPISVYYVNDSFAGAGDWTTAPGDDANGGLTTATPKASVRNVLDTYDLGPGDVILVDEGYYGAGANIVVGEDDSGVTIRGFNTESSGSCRDLS